MACTTETCIPFVIDRTISSNSTGSDISHVSRANVHIDTGDFDGSINYYFEVNAQNTQADAYTIKLYADDGTLEASVSIPQNASGYTLVRSSAFTLVSGSHYHYLKINCTTSYTDKKLMSASIIVTQTSATKTCIYVPIQSTWADTNGSTLARLDACTETGTTYAAGNNTYSQLWLREDAKYSTLAGFEFCASMLGTKAGGGATIGIILHNVTDNTDVAASELTVASTANQYTVYNLRASLAGNETNFANSKVYRFYKKASANGIAYGNIYMKIKVTDMTKAMAWLPVTHYYYSTTAVLNENIRYKYTSTNYGTIDNVYFEGISKCSSSNEKHGLIDLQTADNGSTGYADVTGGELNNSGSTLARMRSADIKANLTSGHRFGTRITVSPSSTLTINTGHLLVCFSTDPGGAVVFVPRIMMF